MANYKVVDARKLDGDLSLVADAIRERAGISEQMAFPDGMAQTVKNIPTGTELPELTSPGSASDLASGMQLIDADGNIVTGTVPEGSLLLLKDETDVVAFPQWYPGEIIVSGKPASDKLVRSGKGVTLYVSGDKFGDAAAADVAKGKTFTSAAGFLVEGTNDIEAQWLAAIERKGVPVTQLPRGLTKIGNQAFYMCDNLKITTIPKEIESIGAEAFNFCLGLTQITFEGKPSSISSTAFKNCALLYDIYVPWAEGEVEGAPWGANYCRVHYNHTGS